MYLFMFKHRIANEEDQEIIEELMESSINQMLGKMLSSDQLEAAKESMGLDTTLIKDKTYFLIFSIYLSNAHSSIFQILCNHP